MPVEVGNDSRGCFARWGNSGKKYYYSCGNTAAMDKAKQKAHIQGAAIGKETMKEAELKEAELELTAEGYLVEATRPQDKPGGSSVGKYKGVKTFCGPAGGAPKGSFPVNTRKRAVAALAYARNAPNPAGIKACVCRHYPDLPACKKKATASEKPDLIVEAISRGNWNG